MQFTGLILGVFAVFASAVATATIGDDEVEIILFVGGQNKGRVWPNGDDWSNLDDNWVSCSKFVYLIPGFTMGRNNPAFIFDAVALSNNSNYNVLLVNYNNTYLLTAPGIASPQIVNFTNQAMSRYSFTKSDIILISFSLGTVVSGYVGRALGGVGKILAFDPCGLQFDLLPNSLRLDSSDAELLVCMHTTDLIGTKRNKMCHINLIWDGGNYPHGCPDTNMFCGHVLALQVLAEAITHCKFEFTFCDTYESYKANECDSNQKVIWDVDMTLPAGAPTVGAQYFYDTPTNINVTNYNIGFFRGSVCSNFRTVSYDDTFC